MVIKCEDVWREISNYLDGDLDPTSEAGDGGAFCAMPSVCCGTRWHAERRRALWRRTNVHPARGLPPTAAPPARWIESKDKEERHGDGWSASQRLAHLPQLFFFASAQNRFAPQPRAQMSQPVRRMPQGLWQSWMGARRFIGPAALICMENIAW